MPLQNLSSALWSTFVQQMTILASLVVLHPAHLRLYEDDIVRFWQRDRAGHGKPSQSHRDEPA